MKRTLGLIAAGTLISALQAGQPAAQTNSQTAAREPLALSEQDKQAVIMAVIEAKSHQKTPKEFTPAVGASVPKAVFIHGFNPSVARAIPTLKQHWYAYLDREIVLIDAMQKKVVAVLPLPTSFVTEGRQHHGAAEPAGSKNEHGAGNTESVPAYTSPETIR